MIALDTNILVYAHRPEMPFHERARKVITGLDIYAALPWPCVHEFIAVVSNRRIFRQPTPARLAADAVAKLVETSQCRLIGEGDGYLDCLGLVVEESGVEGAMVHDARIAAICIHHGVAELWSADRDFSRFPRLKVRNPLVSTND